MGSHAVSAVAAQQQTTPVGRQVGPSPPVGASRAAEDPDTLAFLRQRGEKARLDAAAGRGGLAAEPEARRRQLGAEMEAFWGRRLERAERLGHHLAALPARAAARRSPVPAAAVVAAPAESAAAGAAGAPIQRALNVNQDQLPAALRDAVAASVGQFNQDEDPLSNSKRALHGQFRQLHGIESAVNQHLRDHSATTSDDERQALFGLLRQTQEHHVGLTARTVARGHDLWLPGGVSKKGAKKAKGLWRSLVAGTGNINIDATDPAFRNQALSGFSQLLQGQHGRGLVEELNRPQASADRRILVSGDHTANYALHNKVAAAGSWASGIASVRHDQDLHTVQDGGVANTGTGSFVQIAPAVVPPTLDHHASDQTGRALFSPRYVTLGHELGHARHNLRGTTEAAAWFDGHPLAGQDLQRRLWSNPEEYRNISDEENPIRAEHDLPQRQHHATLRSGRATTNRFNLQTDLDRLWATVPERHRDHIGPRHFGPINQDLDATDLAQPALAQGLRNRVDALEQNLPGAIRRRHIPQAANAALGALGAAGNAAMRPLNAVAGAAAGVVAPPLRAAGNLVAPPLRAAGNLLMAPLNLAGRGLRGLGGWFAPRPQPAQAAAPPRRRRNRRGRRR
jgi:hypothetical protein